MTIDDLLPDPRNPRTITSQAALGLQASLRAFGDLGMAWNRTTGEMVSGHQRVAALRAEANRRGVELRVEEHGDHCFVILPSGDGMEERQFYCRIVEMSRAEQNVANLAANNPGIQGEFTSDVDALLEEARESFPDLYDEMRLGEILAEVEGNPDADTADEAKDAEPQIDRAAELAKTWGTKRGQIWEIPSKTVVGKSHRVMCGDSTSIDVYLAVCGDEAPWMMITDPPYGVEYDATWRGEAGHATLGKNRTGKVENDDREDWSAAYSLFRGDIAYVWHAAIHAASVERQLIDSGFVVRNQIVWNKTVMVMGRGDYHWKHEPCWYAVRKGAAANRTDDKTQTTVWDIASPLHIMSGSLEEKTPHPTQKPLECMSRPIHNHIFPTSRAVYDPFLGSGTTLMAAEHEGRICVGVELSPDYVAVILQRAADIGLTPRLIDEAKP